MANKKNSTDTGKRQETHKITGKAESISKSTGTEVVARAVLSAAMIKREH